MSREQFIASLESLLQDIPVEEREEILQYYRDYFEDGGLEKEEEILAELGTPQKVAERIKNDLGVGSDKEGMYTERGYQSQDKTCAYPPSRKKDFLRDSQGRLDTAKVILWTLIIAIASPFILSIIGTIIGLICSLIGIYVALVGVTMALLASGGIGIFLGIGRLGMNLADGLLAMGVGFVSLALGGLGILLSIQIGFVWGPKLCRKGIGYIRRQMERRKEKVYE